VSREASAVIAKLGFDLRPFEAGDGAALLAVHQAAIQGTSEFYSQAERDSWASGLEASRYAQIYAADEKCLVAVDPEGNPVGFCSFAEDEVRGLFVHPDVQGKGIGKALLNTAESALLNAGRWPIKLEATISARAFYEKSGYKVTEETTGDSRGGLQLAVVKMQKKSMR
jgi:GNAT superfamily N-acetyltransferase